MKKYLLITISILSFGMVQSQEVRDGVRYAQGQLSGTSRFRSMSGAFGALGGDFSAINVNPAGSGVFATSQVGITLANYNVKNKSSYYGSKSDESENTFDLLNQAGAAFVFHPDNDKTNWKKFVLSVNYENTNNFDNSKFSFGTNPTNSVGAYFTNRANNIGVPVGDLDNYYYDAFTLREQTAYLGYHAYVINPTDPLNPDNTTYVSNVAPGGNYYQENTFNSKGYNGKLAFNASTEYRDKFYFGINLNTHFVDYRQSTSFYEDNSNSTTSGLTSLRFDQDLQTYGNGFSFQLGAIAKVTKELRLGLAYESPTWYEFTDEMRQVVHSSGYNFGNAGFGTAATDSDVYITYDPYRLHTPGKWTASGAYVFGKSALISVDYSVKDYGNTKFRPNSDYFDPVNAEFKDQLDVASEIRVGGEYRIKQFSLRGGYRFEGSPYKDGRTIGDLNSFSGGLGYNFGYIKLDVSYAYTQRKSDEGFFSYGFTGGANGAEIKSVYNTVSASLVFQL
ncbi:transporter [Flavobacterium noncentrifugens]|uniref:Outer membrane protein transport protein (OMPP1/FadL/TodX) n=1 Tax=Flavobacterium noncentrifugens TaxID=1128970 RepID=A0A1G8VQG6_9FLAO|nr:outer membrane protein transport protein [Flavobacterium noncentrifugens]GEP50590.1 transporter [Flavobacterium noncentrifugens]SDJ67655.1 Outer membrane protein transport protein (OMPP1/FadL/TodX) [Flavobacterium noncentrifugens]